METKATTTVPFPLPGKSANWQHGDVIELSLLLPRKRADALVALARKKQQSVGQVLRSLIDRALISEN